MIKARIQHFVQDALTSRGLKITHNREDTWSPEIDLFDLIVADHFKASPPRYIVQVGANDGLTHDPVHALIRRYHMTGLVIEPLPDAFASLEQTYADLPGITPINAAISDADGERLIYRIAPTTDELSKLSQLASFNREVVEKHSRMYIQEDARIIATPVRSVTPRTLLAEHPLPRIDILQIDTEGFDAEVVRMFLEAGILPGVIQYEHRHLSGSADTACRALLHDRGYRLARYGGDTAALRTERHANHVAPHASEPRRHHEPSSRQAPLITQY